ncbi:flagellin [Lichenibacterium dinghuense]|uniref:flagellin N-terminal helical domain-containing protein n=1 Tax=Lichenibacterium dinghuense TaxID=2895977 RepID=UPI001F2599B4|nr:flagellin [Lichenibacterium sp. 6Y81]
MTASILTNSFAMTALQNLSATQEALNTTQSQISSGLKVATASDNAAYWSISSTLKSDTGALSSVSDALNLGSSVVGTATAAVTSTLTLLNKIKTDLVTAQQPGASLAAVQTDITAQQRSIVAVLASASFNGVNLVDGSSGASASFVTSFTRNASGTTSVGKTSLSTAGGFVAGPQIAGTQLVGVGGLLSTGYLAYYGLSSGAYGTAGTGTGANAYQPASLLSFNITSATPSDLKLLQAAVDTYLGYVTTVGTMIGATQTTITNQQSYVSSLSDAITSGVGSLVDADMNVASTRLQALQTQQQLGIQALSIANQNSQLILKLFQAA